MLYRQQIPGYVPSVHSSVNKFLYCVPGDRVQNNLTLKLYGQFHQWHADFSQTWKEIINHPFCFSWCTSSAPGRNYSSIGDRLGRVRPTRLQQPSGGRKDPELFLMGCRHRFASPGNADRLWYWKHGRAGPQIDDCEFYKSAYVCYVLCDFSCSWLQSPLFHLTLALRRIVMFNDIVYEYSQYHLIHCLFGFRQRLFACLIDWLIGWLRRCFATCLRTCRLQDSDSILRLFRMSAWELLKWQEMNILVSFLAQNIEWNASIGCQCARKLGLGSLAGGHMYWKYKDRLRLTVKTPFYRPDALHLDHASYHNRKHSHTLLIYRPRRANRGDKLYKLNFSVGGTKTYTDSFRFTPRCPSVDIGNLWIISIRPGGCWLLLYKPCGCASSGPGTWRGPWIFFSETEKMATKKPPHFCEWKYWCRTCFFDGISMDFQGFSNYSFYHLVLKALFFLINIRIPKLAKDVYGIWKTWMKSWRRFPNVDSLSALLMAPSNVSLVFRYWSLLHVICSSSAVRTSVALSSRQGCYHVDRANLHLTSTSDARCLQFVQWLWMLAFGQDLVMPRCMQSTHTRIIHNHNQTYNMTFLSMHTYIDIYIYKYYIIEPHVMFVTHQVKPGSLGTVTRCRTLVNPPGVTWPRLRGWPGFYGLEYTSTPKRLDFNSLNRAWILHCLFLKRFFLCFWLL